MTRGPLALLSRMDPASVKTWLEALSAALPDETILAFDDMSDEQKAQTEVAIVANPDPAQIASLPALRWIHSLWAGVERLMAELGPSAPPLVRLTDPEMSRSMSEAVLAWTYYLQRDMPAYRQHQQERLWKSFDYRSPSEMTVGLLGLGVLGKASAARLESAGFNVIGWSRSKHELPSVETFSGEDGLETLLGRSDIVVCLIPLTAQTRGLLGASRISMMKQGASVINFARGPVIVTNDLVAALDSGQLNHAVLDVFDIEPLPQDSVLWQHRNITVLPHISGPTNMTTASGIVAKNVLAWRQSGVIPATVDRSRGY